VCEHETIKEGRGRLLVSHLLRRATALLVYG